METCLAATECKTPVLLKTELLEWEKNETGLYIGPFCSKPLLEHDYWPTELWSAAYLEIQLINDQFCLAWLLASSHLEGCLT